MSRPRGPSRIRHLGVAHADARLVEVVARMPHGAVLDPTWPQTLDGVLASASRRLRLGDDYGAVCRTEADEIREHGRVWSTSTGDHRHELLPLARATTGMGQQWVWAASGAVPVDGAGEEVRWWHKRFDHEAAERVAGSHLPPIVRESMSRYRSWRMPEVVTVCSGLRWWCAGDPAGIELLLTSVHSIGRARAQGEGAVFGWRVVDHGPLVDQPPAPEKGRVPYLDRVLWTDDGRISRPVPMRAWQALGLDAEPDLVDAAIRPPYWRPPQTQAADGSFARAWRPVVAPWTTRTRERR